MKKSTISAIIVALTPLSATAIPPVTPGPLHDTWFETQVKVTNPTGIKSESSLGFSSVVKSVKGDSGKKTCYSHALDNLDPVTKLYQIHTYCNSGTANSPQYEFVDYTVLKQGNDGNTGTSKFSLDLPVQGTSAYTAPTSTIGFMGQIILSPKLKNSQLRNVTITTPNSGLVYIWNKPDGIVSTDKAKGLTFKYIPVDKVPADAKTCADNYEHGVVTATNCDSNDHPNPPIIPPLFD